VHKLAGFAYGIAFKHPSVYILDSSHDSIIIHFQGKLELLSLLL